MDNKTRDTQCRYEDFKKNKQVQNVVKVLVGKHFTLYCSKAFNEINQVA